MKRFPELMYFGLCITIWPVERGELLYLENVDFVIPFLVHYFFNVSENVMTRNRKRTGSMLSPCLTNTLKNTGVSIFQLYVSTQCFSKLF